MKYICCQGHTVTRCLFSNILPNIGIVKGTVTRFNEIILKFYFTNFNNYKAELGKDKILP